MTKLAIPPEVLEQHVAVLGKTGSGKSSVMRGLWEWLLDHEKPSGMIDPKGDWWGIKASADGKHAGYPVVIFGGQHADVPINERSGAHVAELVATGNRPFLMDLSQFLVGQRTRFFIDFAEKYYITIRGIRWLFIDEVHNFAPQGKVFDVDAGKMLHWANKIGAEGRGKGLQLVVASQKSQKVHKDLLDSCETLIAMRAVNPRSRKAVQDWIEGAGDPERGAEVLATLAQMPRGTGWVWSPEIGFGPERVKFPMFKTFDSFKPQEHGQDSQPKGWAEVDLDEVKQKLAAVVKEAEANDPKLLRAELASLRKENADLRAQHADVALDPKVLAQAGAMIGQAAQSVRDAEFHAKSAGGKIDALEQVVQKLATTKFEPRPQAPKPEAPRPRQPSGQRQSGAAAGDGSNLSKAERQVLTVLAQLQPEAVDQDRLAILAGYSPNTGHFNNTVGALRSRGLITKGWPVEILEPGLAALGAYDPLPRGAELLDYWKGRLGKAERLILEAAAEAYPDSLTKGQLAARAGYEANTGHFNNSLGRLRTMRLLVGRSDIKASEVFFQ